MRVLVTTGLFPRVLNGAAVTRAGGLVLEGEEVSRDSVAAAARWLLTDPGTATAPRPSAARST
jgi:hypothetical protein